MPRESGFRSAIVSVWFRLMSLGMVGLVFAEALFVARARVQGWTFYLTTSEVVFEVLVRVIFAALAGMILGSICTALLALFLWHFSASRDRLVEWATRVGVVLVLVPNSRFALIALIKWSNRGVRFTSALLVAHLVAFAIALCIPRTRKAVVTSLDDFVGEKMTRRMALATVGGAAALAVTELAFSKAPRAAMAVLAPASRPKSNFLLVTFDAFTAEEMSLYGYKQLTTPNLDAFGRKSTVFTNYYSGSSSTTPCIGVMLTGGCPSESHVYGLSGQVPPENAEKSLPHAMRAGGYATGAFLTNPWAYYLSKSLRNGFEVMPEPIFHPGGMQNLWDATRPLHQDSRIGSRIDEYFELEGVWNMLSRNPESLAFRFRPAASFEHARQILAQMPDGFFLWVHVLPPHHPYLPDPPDQNRFIPQAELLSYKEEPWSKWKPSYEPDQQSQVDRRRLGYDEYVMSTDRAFGAFMSDVENDGRLRNTTVIVSADHGESFEGGIYQHETAYLTRPVIHIPLIVRTPGQQDGRTVAYTADQTALAPTILELAGQKKPDWMRGQSLAGWLNRNGQGDGEGQAFCQYLERNSAFRPLRHGTVGVIDGRSKYQYVLDLDTQKGWLRPLQEAHIWDLDRTAENPALATALRAAIYSRFPELPQTVS